MIIEEDMRDNVSPIYQARDISVEVGTKELLRDVSVSIFPDDRIGLVGSNGSGKTTLLKILSGDIKPERGEILSNGTLEYVPQIASITSGESILEFTSRKNAEWWNVFSLMEQKFDSQIENLDQRVSSLSGGELTKLNICIALLNNPDILLLDEPTNHLDLHSISKLIKIVNEYHGAVIIVSHDSFFLDQVTHKTWEISNNSLKSFAGNYSELQKNKSNELSQIERSISGKKKEYKKTIARRAEIQQENAKVNKIGGKLKGDRSMSAIEKGYFKNRATGTAGKKSAQISGEVSDLNSQIQELRVRKEELSVKSPYMDIETAEVGRRRLMGVRDGVLSIRDKVLVHGINLDIYFGDRVVLGGRNGVGKTALVKALLGSDSIFTLSGDAYLAEAKIAYLSQRYERVQPDKSIYENLKIFDPRMSYQEARRILANFLFIDERDLEKKASVLSGGELARLSLILATVNAIDILILDEPTNNLDQKSIDEFVRALSNYRGAVMVISHNLDFLDKIGVKESYAIGKDKKFRKMLTIPHNSKEYFDELIKI